jgi:MYXO-CTERM domain-containing protein
VVFASAPAGATELGIDMNQPVAGGVANAAAVAAIAGLGASWVRVDFVLDVWSSPTDATPRGPAKKTWFETYDALVDGYLAQGVQVYGLLGAGSTSATGDPASDAWQTAFVADAASIVDHFKDRVRVYEVFNEPNNWVAPNTPALAPADFAHLLARTYQAIKLDHASDPCWQVTVVSGPILSLDVTTGAQYLTQTYDAGKAMYGWDTMKAQSGTYPLDGVGYHVYVAQGATSTQATVASAVTANLQAFWGAFTAEEGAGTGKRIHLSEFGWQTGAVSAMQQADFMEAGLGAVDATGVVSTAIWFSLQDFGAGDQWGVFTGPPYDAAHQKPSAARFQTLAASHRPALAAHMPANTVPASMTAGATAPVSVQVMNDGSAKWNASGSAPVRLGAGPGCPEASATNQLPWSGFANGGYENAISDARAFAAADTGPGSTETFSFTVTAPAAPGSYLLAARMVKEGVAWFGSTLAVPVTVLPVGGDAGPPGSGGGGTGGAPGSGSAGAGATAGSSGGGSPGPGAKGGCGCRVAGAGAEKSALALGAVAALFLRARRKGHILEA